jgi:hypothetical protein
MKCSVSPYFFTKLSPRLAYGRRDMFCLTMLSSSTGAAIEAGRGYHGYAGLGFVRAGTLGELKAKGRLLVRGRHRPNLLIYGQCICPRRIA